MRIAGPGFMSRLKLSSNFRITLGLLCALLLFAGSVNFAQTTAKPSGQSTASTQNPNSRNSPSNNSKDAAYAKYLSERHDVRQFQRNQERKEEIQQRKVDNPEAEDSANVYRHSPMVHTLAGIFGLSVETTARIFEILNFFILMAAIVWFVARLLPKTLRSRTERIQNEMQRARTATENANRRLADVEQRLGRLDKEIAEIKIKAEQDTAAEEQRLRAAMEQEKQLILATAGQEIAVAGMNAQRQLKNFAAELAIEHAKRRIAVSADADSLLINDFVADLTEKSSRGGVN